MEVRIISEQEVRDIVLSILSEEMNSELWCEDGSIRMDIKRLKPSDGINSHAIDDLYERVKTIENNATVNLSCLFLFLQYNLLHIALDL